MLLAVAVDAGRLGMFDDLLIRPQADCSLSVEEAERVAAVRAGVAEVAAGRLPEELKEAVKADVARDLWVGKRTEGIDDNLERALVRLRAEYDFLASRKRLPDPSRITALMREYETGHTSDQINEHARYLWKKYGWGQVFTDYNDILKNHGMRMENGTLTITNEPG